MSISLASYKRARLAFACSLLLPIAANGVAAELKASLKVPKVAKSLLLDVEQAGERLVIVGEKGHIIYSDDQGVNWTQADVPVSQMITAVSFADDSVGWAAAHDGHVLQTTNGGQTWTLQRNGLGAQAEANVRKLKQSKQKLRELKQKLASVSHDDALYAEIETLLDDAQWDLESAEEKSQSAPIANPLLDIWFMDSRRGWAVGAFGQFLYTKNGGITWHDAKDSFDNEMGYHLNAVSGTKDGSVFVGGEAGFLMYSNDAGQTWARATLDSESTIFGLDASDDGETIYSTGLRAQTFRSTDDGANWVQVQPNVNFSLAGVNVADNGAILLVGAGGSVAYSQNNGEHFTQYTLPSRSSLVSTLMLDNGNYVIVGEGGVYTYDPKAAAK